MAYTNIDDPSVHFQTALYTGNGGTLAVTNDGNSDLQPDLVWTKKRSDTSHNALVDSSRGATKQIYSNLTAAEETVSGVTAFNTDGFTLGSNGTANGNGGTFVGWQWKANGGTTASNTDGTITTTTQVNSDAGFSIVTWAGGGTGSLGHGLGEVPDMWIVKNRDYAVSWSVGFSDSSILGGTSNYLSLNTTGAIATYNNIWGSSPVNSSVITMAGDRSVNISGDDYVAYFFKAKQGYSKFGKYVGNGSADGPFVYTGFKPAWIMVKNIDSGIDHWHIIDNKRNPNNVAGKLLFADLANAEITYTTETLFDILSNGFKLRGDYDHINKSGETIIYMAFAENPFVTSTGIPTTAR